MDLSTDMTFCMLKGRLAEEENDFVTSEAFSLPFLKQSFAKNCLQVTQMTAKITQKADRAVLSMLNA